MNKVFELLHPAGLRIAPGLEEAVLVESHGALILHRRETGPGWVWYRLEPWLDGGFRLGIELAFHQGALVEYVLFHDDESAYGRGWDEWSEHKERRRAKALRKWLAVRGWAPGLYGWGEVWAGYDPRAGFGGGGVRYSRAGDI